MVAVLSLFGSPASAEAPRVTTVPLASVLETPTYSAPASVIARQEPRIAAEVAASVVELPVWIGDQVDVGTVLARLDCARFEAQRNAERAAVARAQANKRFATRQLRRAEDLRKKRSISEEVLDQRQTELASSDTEELSAAAALAQAEIDVRACELRSPLAGVVTARHVSVGDYVTPGTAVLSLTATTHQEVSVALRADQIPGFRDSRSWQFVNGNDSYALTLRTIVPVVDNISRTREARLDFAEAAAMPGTPGRVTWQATRQQIPANFLVRRNRTLGVFVLVDGKARFIALPDAEEGRPADSSLSRDLQLIAEGRQGLSDGDAVDIVNGEGASQ